METIKKFITKYYEQLAYLFFGGLATLLNLIVFAVFQLAFGTDFATGIGNIIDNIICILFAYWTNRTFVFRSQNHGADALREFGKFVAFRMLTLVMDQVIIMLGVQLVGPAIGFAVDAGGVLGPVGHGRQAVQPGGGHPLQLCVLQAVHLQKQQ